jgi:hypothetical protein
MIAGIENHRIGSGSSAGIGIVLWILTFFFHVSCVDQKMTVKEAKQVTVSMGGKSFEPPPRHVDDILAVLNEADPVYHAMVYRLRETAAAGEWVKRDRGPYSPALEVGAPVDGD